MIKKQEMCLRKLYARVLAAGNGDDMCMPDWVAEELARKESIDVIIELLNDIPNSCNWLQVT